MNATQVEQIRTVPELQIAMLNANLGLTGRDFEYHATDLYVVSLPGVVNWLKRNYKHFENVTCFVGQEGADWNGSGKVCLDIPFAGFWGR